MSTKLWPAMKDFSRKRASSMTCQPASFKQALMWASFGYYAFTPYTWRGIAQDSHSFLLASGLHVNSIYDMLGHGQLTEFVVARATPRSVCQTSSFFSCYELSNICKHQHFKKFFSANLQQLWLDFPYSPENYAIHESKEKYLWTIS